MAASITITVPSSAEEGERVSVSVVLWNTAEYLYAFRTEIHAVPDLYPTYLIFTRDEVIEGGEARTYSASFTMPDCKTTVLVWVERWDVNRYVYDKAASKVVSLEIPAPATFHLSVFVPTWAYGGYVQPSSGDYPANSTVKLTAYPLSGYQFLSWGRDASGTSPTYNLYMNSDKNVEAYFEKVPVPEFAGTISKKQLEYDESRASIPAYDIPQNQRGLVHIWGRNDMATSQKLGIHWIVKDPDGLIVEDYQDWQFGSASPGATHEFIGGRFDINKTGNWTIAISLSMNPASPLTVDSYSGVLCTVAMAPEYKGTITKKELEYDESRKAIPVY